MIPPSQRLMIPLSDAEFDELSDFLLSPSTSDESMLMDSLDGFLTAIAVGPRTLGLSDWLHRVWGGKDQSPAFRTTEHAEHVINLILRQMNSVIFSLQHDPDAFVPVMETTQYQKDGRQYLDGEMWSYGFMQGVDLCRKDWEPIFNDAGGAAAMRPIVLLGADDLSNVEDELTKTPNQREELAHKVSASVATIYRFWLPYREAVHERQIAATYQREHPKVGRNDPCPCGSGKKFKKCCGRAVELH